MAKEPIEIRLADEDKKDLIESLLKYQKQDRKFVMDQYKVLIKQNEKNWRADKLREMLREEMANSPQFKEYEESIAGKLQKLSDILIIGNSIERRNRRSRDAMQRMTEGQYKHWKAMQDAMPLNWRASIGGAIGGTGRAIGGMLGGVKNSKTGNSAFNTLMQSNPLTALIYQNADMLKGLGGIGRAIFKNPLAKMAGHGLGYLAESAAAKIGLTSKGKSLLSLGSKTSQAEEEVASNAEKMLELRQQAEMVPIQGGQNVLSAQNVSINGGQQQIIAQNVIIQGGQQIIGQAPNAGPQGSGMRNANQLMLPGSSVPRLANPAQAKFQKGVSGFITNITGSMKTVTDVLKIMKAKQLLIGLGIAALVAGVAALAKWIYDKFGGKRRPADNVTPSTSGFAANSNEGAQKINAGFEGAKETRNDTISKVTNAINSNANISGHSNIKDVWGKHIGASFKSKQNAPYRAPFDGEVIKWKHNEGLNNGDEYDLHVKRTDKKGGKFILKNVANPLAVAGTAFKRGDIIGFVGKTGNINVVRDGSGFGNGLSADEMDAYEQMYNGKANASQDIKQQEINNFNKNYTDATAEARRQTFAQDYDATQKQEAAKYSPKTAGMARFEAPAEYIDPATGKVIANPAIQSQNADIAARNSQQISNQQKKNQQKQNEQKNQGTSSKPVNVSSSGQHPDKVAFQPTNASLQIQQQNTTAFAAATGIG